MVSREGPFTIFEAGARVDGGPYTARQIAAMFARFGFSPEKIRACEVHAASGFVWSAENFLEEHAVDCVLAAWAAGTKNAAVGRQRKLHDWWPALATALDALEEADGA